MIEEKSKENFKKYSILLNIVMLISFSFLFLIIYNPNSYEKFNAEVTDVLKYVYLFVSLAIIFYYLFFLKRNIVIDAFLNINKCTLIVSLIAFAGAMYSIFEYYTSNALSYVFGGLSAFCVYVLVLKIVEFSIKLWKNFYSKFNKKIKVLFFVTISAFSLLSLLMYPFTDLFINPYLEWDALLSFDSGVHSDMNFYLNLFGTANDLRHLLLTFAMAPFALIPFIISKCFWFIPKLYLLLLSFVQIFVMAYCVLRLILLFVDKESFGKVQMFLFVTLMFTSTALINMLALEKFVFAMFFIVETVAMSFENKHEKWILFILAISSLTTNLFLLPIVLFSEKKTWKNHLLDTIKIGLMYVALLMITGQFNILLNIYESWKNISRFTGIIQNYTVWEKLMQFFISVANLILIPRGFVTGNIYKQIEPSFDYMCIIGIILLAMIVVGFVLNRKDKFAQISFYWIFFMIFLLVVVGWGSPLNDMFIYSAIFAWALVYLLYKFASSVIKNKKTLIIVVVIISLSVVVYNMVEFIKIVDFGVTYYPTIFK